VDEQVDVAVVGAGPAGATAALTLARRGVRVLLVGRAERPAIRIGEGLPPAARPLLESLGLWTRFQRAGHLPSYGNRSAWGSSELVDKDFIFNPYGHGWHLDRHAFDAMLVGAAEDAGASFVCSTHMRWQPVAAGGRLRLRQADRELTVQASTALDCTGRAATVAGRHGVRRLHRDKLVAVAVVQVPMTGDDSDASTLVEATPDGWWYTSLLPGKQRIFVFLTDGDLLEPGTAREVDKWHARLGRTEHLRRIHERFDYRILSPPIVVPTGSSRLCPAAGDGWLAAGDAAISFDPLSSQGILSAMSTGIRAAETLLQSRNGNSGAVQDYLSMLDQIDGAYLANRQRYYAMERRWADSTFWKRRAIG